jgi:predicted permease
MNAAMFKSLPVLAPEQLVQLNRGKEDGFTYALWQQIRAKQDVFSNVFAYRGNLFDIADGGEKHLVSGIYVSGSYFSALGVPAVIGRTLTEQDNTRGAPNMAMISYALWQRQFAGDPAVIGHPLTLDKHLFNIIGVAPRGFHGMDVGFDFDVAVPLVANRIIEPEHPVIDSARGFWLLVFGRLKRGVSFEQARERIAVLAPFISRAALPPALDHAIEQRYMERIGIEPGATGISELSEGYGRALILLSVMVGVVLLIACVNVANLLLARARGRRYEFAVRVALGAARGRLIRQLLTESLMLSAGGAAVGMFLAHWGGQLLVRATSYRWQRSFLDLSLDLHILLFVLGVTVATALIFGLAPALQLANAAPQTVLKESSRAIAGRRRWELTRILVPAQIALSIVLLFGATLFVRSLRGLLTQDLGFQKESVLLLNTDLRGIRSADPQQQQLVEDLTERLRALPGVRSVSRSAVTPISRELWSWDVEPDTPGASVRKIHVFANAVSPGFFKTFGTPLIAGRDFDEHDAAASPPVGILNQAAAQEMFPGAYPIGRSYHDRLDPKRNLVIQIVGIAKDAKYLSLRDPAPPTIYIPIAQDPPAPPRIGTFALRFSGPISPIVKEVEDAAQSTDPLISLDFEPLSAQVSDSLQQVYLITGLASAFSMLALVLACIGIYGVMAYDVSRRTAEIGIRMALGARRSDVVGMVLRESFLLASAGIVIGIPAAVVVSMLIKTMLFGVQPADPLTAAATIAIVFGTAVLASYWPARRAARVDPMVALRYE